MITEEQARGAAAFIAQNGCDMESDAPERTLATWAAQELSRRDAERIERAKPIDAEWCVINGGRLSRDKQHVSWAIDDDGAEVWWNQVTGGVSVEFGYYIIYLHAIQSRGPLRDLLSALKGGAS